MKILVYSAAATDSIEHHLGMADYSYFFVKQMFSPVLSKIGDVVDIRDPEAEVDNIYIDCLSRKELCVYLSFTPPHKSLIDLKCPTICVFAWEYGTLPADPWNKNPKNDWRFVLNRHGSAITHSSFAADIVREALSREFPVISVPAPLWDSMANLRSQAVCCPQHHVFELEVAGIVIDTHLFDADQVTPEKRVEFINQAIEMQSGRGKQSISIRGLVYTAIFNPNDGRKNWRDFVYAFCWAFRNHADVTLVMKLSYRDCFFSLNVLLEEMYKLAPFNCRLILIHGFLSTDAYQTLIRGSHYSINSAYGEGQCLPLMEFMSAGKPVIAPNHTAMADYLDSENSFVVNWSREWTHWPHDPRALKRTFRYRIDWSSLVSALKDSYQVALEDWDRYQRMSAAAVKKMEQHCSESVCEAALRELLQDHALCRASPTEFSLPGTREVYGTSGWKSIFVRVLSMLKKIRAHIGRSSLQ